MAAGVIVYGARSKIIRRIVVPGPGESLPVGICQPGEAMLRAEIGMCDGLPRMDDAARCVTDVTGIIPPSGRCAVIRDGVVVNVINADPHLDEITDCTLVLSETAAIGWAWTTDAGFSAPMVGPASDIVSLPAGVIIA